MLKLGNRSVSTFSGSVPNGSVPRYREDKVRGGVRFEMWQIP